MEYFTLRNGLQMPVIGAGTYQMHTADTLANLEAGYRMIDCGSIYGNEAEVGEAIRQSGIVREELFITTKLWNGDMQNRCVREAFEESCERLGTDYIDMYQTHWPVSDGFAEAWKVLEQLQDEGRIRVLAVCNCHPQHIELLKQQGSRLPEVNQVEVHPLLTQFPLQEYCRENGILLQCWSPLGQGRLKANAAAWQTITEIGAAYGKSPAQAVLRWDYQRGISAVPKSADPKRMRENLDIFSFELSDRDMYRISTLNRDFRTAGNPDTFENT